MPSFGNPMFRRLLDWYGRRRDKKERTLLSMLSYRGELRGLDIIKLSDGMFRRGTVYVFLEQMIRRGWVTYRAIPYVFAETFQPHHEESAPPFHINYYSITPKGRDRLAQLGEPSNPYRR